MNIKLKSILSAAALGLGLIAAARAAEPTEVTSLDDIKTWVGEGQNEIGVLVDFSGCGAWAWGYRWEGERPNNETILAAILAPKSVGGTLDTTAGTFAGTVPNL